MINFYNKFLLCILFSIGVTGFVWAGDFDYISGSAVSKIDAMPTDCIGYSGTENLYISESFVDDGKIYTTIRDEVFSNRDIFLGTSGTKVQYFDEKNTFLGCANQGNSNSFKKEFMKVSKLVKKNDTDVVGLLGVNCAFDVNSIKSNGSPLTVAFQFDIWTKDIFEDSNGYHNYYYTKTEDITVDNNITKIDPQISTDKWKITSVGFSHPKECLFVNFHRCGDGVVDTKNLWTKNGWGTLGQDEECDPKAPGRNNSTCDANCKQNQQNNLSCNSIKCEVGQTEIPLNNNTVFQTGLEYTFTVVSGGNAPVSGYNFTISSGSSILTGMTNKTGIFKYTFSNLSSNISLSGIVVGIDNVQYGGNQCSAGSLSVGQLPACQILNQLGGTNILSSDAGSVAVQCSGSSLTQNSLYRYVIDCGQYSNQTGANAISGDSTSGYLIGTCNYTGFPSNTTLSNNITCNIFSGNTMLPANSQCVYGVSRSGGGGGPWCGDGIRNSTEECDYADTTRQGWRDIGNYDTNKGLYPSTVTIYTGNDSANTVRYCPSDCVYRSSSGGGGGGGSGGGNPGTLPNDNKYNFYDIPRCRDLDPPSIQVGEMVPVWWKMDGFFVSSDSNGKSKPDPPVSDCTNSDNYGKIKDNGDKTLQCYFQIVNARGQYWNLPGISCYNNEKSTLFDSLKTLHHIKNNPVYSGMLVTAILSGSNFYSGSDKISADNLALGDYKIWLRGVTYEVCREGKAGKAGKESMYYIGPFGYNIKYFNIAQQNQKLKDFYNTPCSWDFVVTKPYLMQKGTMLSTSENIDLGDFYAMVKNKAQQIIKGLGLVIEKVGYTGGENVNYLSNDFINKYKKLAVQTDKIFGGKKVASKEIYVVNNDLTLDKQSLPTNPFTLIVDGDLTVNLKDYSKSGYGMYIVTGKIKFVGGCSNPGNLKGIFIAKTGFDADQIINNNLENNWCSDGRVSIDGLLIGNGIDNIWQKRRSKIDCAGNYSWHHFAEIIDSSKKNILKTALLKSASLSVQPSTELWSNLPPGANELLQKLKIYKK